MTTTTKPRLAAEQVRIERAYRNVITLFLAGRLGNFSHQRHVHVANILWHLPYGRELMHLGLQVMAYRNLYGSNGVILDARYPSVRTRCP